MTREMSDYNHAHNKMSHDQKSYSLATRTGMAATGRNNRLNQTLDSIRPNNFVSNEILHQNSAASTTIYNK